MIAGSVAGAWLVKREGIGVLRRAREQVQAGRVPGSELVDGVLILFAAALCSRPASLPTSSASSSSCHRCGRC